MFLGYKMIMYFILNQYQVCSKWSIHFAIYFNHSSMIYVQFYCLILNYLYYVGEWLRFTSRWLHWDRCTICERDDGIHRRQIVIEMNTFSELFLCSFSGVQNRLYIENISRKQENFQFKDMAETKHDWRTCIVIMICIHMKISCLKNFSVPFNEKGNKFN